MAGKIKSMGQIKQLLILHQQGKGIKTIALTLSMRKSTNNRAAMAKDILSPVSPLSATSCRDSF